MIPQDVADLTPAFFAEALRRDVDSAVLLDQHSGTTGRSRFRLSGDSALAAEVPVRVPHPYYAATDDERYVMVLEDLEASGCRFPSPRDPDIERRGGDIVEQLAALH